jgi:hypothetical protein
LVGIGTKRINIPTSGKRVKFTLPAKEEKVKLTPLFGRGLFEELGLDVSNGLREGFPELLEIFLVQEDLVLLILIVTNTLALGDRDVEVFLGLRRFHIEEVGPLSGPDAFCEDLIFVAIGIQIPPPLSLVIE